MAQKGNFCMLLPLNYHMHRNTRASSSQLWQVTFGSGADAPVLIQRPPLIFHAGDKHVRGGQEWDGTPLRGTPLRWFSQLRFQF